MDFFRIYRRVLGLLGPERRLGIILAVANVVVASLAYLEPVLFGRIVDVLSKGASMPPAQWLVASVISASLRSYRVTAWPACAKSSACHAPAMPAPMMETRESPRRSDFWYIPVPSPA